MLPVAVLVSFSRVYNGVHYPERRAGGRDPRRGTGFAVVFGLECALALGRAKMVSALARTACLRWYPGGPTDTESRLTVLDLQLGNSRNSNQHWLRAGYVLIVVLPLARWIYIASGTIELSEDEAYQWVWSKHLALSYYSKPPLIAYTQFLGTTLWGDTAFGVRFFSPVIAAILGLLVLRFFAREVNARAGFFLVLIVTATPLLAVGATLLTVDPLSVLFWTAAMLAGWRAVQENSTTSAWLWVGLWMGLGFLSKYTSPLPIAVLGGVLRRSGRRRGNNCAAPARIWPCWSTCSARCRCSSGTGSTIGSPSTMSPRMAASAKPWHADSAILSGLNSSAPNSAAEPDLLRGAR